MEPLDAAKYERLMNGLEAVETKLSEVIKDNHTKRYDSEYFKKEYLNTDEKLIHLKSDHFEEIGNVRGGKRLPLDEDFTEKGVPYVRAEDVKNSFVVYENSPKVSFELNRELEEYQNFYNDVLLTIVGNSIGDVGIIKFKIDKCNLTENAVKLIDLKINPDYLFAFLKSKYGQNQIQREKVGTAQPKLSIERIRKFKIPLLGKNFQVTNEQINNKAYDIFTQSIALYDKVEILLLNKLHLEAI